MMGSCSSKPGEVGAMPIAGVGRVEPMDPVVKREVMRRARESGKISVQTSRPRLNSCRNTCSDECVTLNVEFCAGYAGVMICNVKESRRQSNGIACAKIKMNAPS